MSATGFSGSPPPPMPTPGAHSQLLESAAIIFGKCLEPDLMHEEVQRRWIAQDHGHVSHRLQGVTPTPHASPGCHTLGISSPHGLAACP